MHAALYTVIAYIEMSICNAFNVPLWLISPRGALGDGSSLITSYAFFNGRTIGRLASTFVAINTRRGKTRNTRARLAFRGTSNNQATSDSITVIHVAGRSTLDDRCIVSVKTRTAGGNAVCVVLRSFRGRQNTRAGITDTTIGEEHTGG